jgi:repressor LexA
VVTLTGEKPRRNKRLLRVVPSGSIEYSLFFRLYSEAVNPTPRQKQILDFVTRSIDRRGFAPSIQEICDHFDLASTATVHKHLKNLAARGLLNRESNRSRALEVPSASPAQGVEIPLLGRVAAGAPIEAVANHDTISSPADWLGRGERYALRVHGESMIDAHIEDGDVVVVERKDVARDGDMVIALVDDTEVTVKVYRTQADGRIRLEPRNENLKPMIFDANRVRVQGTVVGVLRRYAR